MRAYAAILLPTGYERGGKPMRDIAWAENPDRAKALLQEVHPTHRVFSLTDHTDKIGAP